MKHQREGAVDRARKLRQTQTDVERRLWSRLRSRSLTGHKFRRQHPIGPYVADFACIERMLIVELDGDQHGEKIEHDQQRTAYLVEQGFFVLRFWNNEINHNLEGVLETILVALEEARGA